MKKYLVGLIFLISSFAEAMVVTDTITKNSNFFYLNSPPFFAVFPLSNDSTEKPNKVLCDDGLASIALIQKYLKQTNGQQRELLQQLLINALVRLKKSISIQNDEMQKEIDILIALFNPRDGQRLDNLDARLDTLQKFVSLHEQGFRYIIHGFISEIDKTTKKEKITKKLLYRSFQQVLTQMEIKDMPPLVIHLKKDLDVDISEKGGSPKLYKVVTINKSFDGAEDERIKAFAKESKQIITKGTPEYDLVLNILRSIDAAFPFFNRDGKKRIGEIALLSAEGIKTLTSGDDQSNLANLRNFFNREKNNELSRFLLPKTDGTEPLYLVWSIDWSDNCCDRYWIFEVQPIPSPDTEIKAGVTLHTRLGSKEDPEILGVLFFGLENLLDQIDCY